ncbi:hypothetical protein GJ744_006432 [Endocarpon pusillum]|uniref:Uncharacterized protein n=1 Tax=Endocarpon pusillum TaxID=364733 RepID=A0A8H7A779_9EURO|nr:hypothetical protein GJ744_006432 [Endocarpon pusillum]
MKVSRRLKRKRDVFDSGPNARDSRPKVVAYRYFVPAVRSSAASCLWLTYKKAKRRSLSVGYPQPEF